MRANNAFAPFILPMLVTASALWAPIARAAPGGIITNHPPGGSFVVHTDAAEFEVTPAGDVQAFLLRDGGRLTLDGPVPLAPELQAGGKPASLGSISITRGCRRSAAT